MTDTDLPERFDLSSEVPSDDRLSAIRAVFPDAVRDGRIDFDALRRSLGDSVESGPERFGLTWPGKAECMRVIQEPSIGTLAPMPDESADWDTTQNVIIEGDNLEVLKLLQKAYYGKVKMIYIDPPYNTGNEFIYPDNYREGLADYLRFSGQTDESGLKLAANAETDGRFHSKWLSMIYPRLFLARNLLTDDGAIFVSIDDGEAANLRLIMNDLFGEENFLASIAWEKRYTRSNNARRFYSLKDTVIVYRKSEALEVLREERTEKSDAIYDNPDDDERGPWTSSSYVNPATREARPNLVYSIINPTSGAEVSHPTHAWKYSREEHARHVAEDYLWWGRDGTAKYPRLKNFLSEVEDGLVPIDLWDHKSTGTTDEGGAEVKELFDGEAIFDNPKPTRLVRRMLRLLTTPEEGAIVLDFFAGSGTTGHAVMAQNRADDGNRRYVLVQLPEPIEGREGIPTIAALMRQRVRRAASAIGSEQPNLGSVTPDLGYRAFKLTASNFRVWNPTADEVEDQLELSVDHLTGDATETSILSELLLKAGYPLASPVASVEFAGIHGYSVADGALLVCLSQDLSIEAFEAMAELEPAMIVVLDAGFGGSDELKVNALQTVRARNQQSGSDISLRVV